MTFKEVDKYTDIHDWLYRAIYDPTLIARVEAKIDAFNVDDFFNECASNTGGNAERLNDYFNILEQKLNYRNYSEQPYLSYYLTEQKYFDSAKKRWAKSVRNYTPEQMEKYANSLMLAMLRLNKITLMIDDIIHVKLFRMAGLDPLSDEERGIPKDVRFWGKFLEPLIEPQKPPQDATNTDSLAVEQSEPQQTNQEPQKKQQPRRRGRPTEPFASKMIDDANGEKLKKMHKVLAGKKGKDFALLIWACTKKGWCNKPTYTQAKEEFGDIGSDTGYNRYLNNINMFTQEEKDGALKSLD